MRWVDRVAGRRASSSAKRLTKSLENARVIAEGRQGAALKIGNAIHATSPWQIILPDRARGGWSAVPTCACAAGRFGDPGSGRLGRSRATESLLAARNGVKFVTEACGRVDAGRGTGISRSGRRHLSSFPVGIRRGEEKATRLSLDSLVLRPPPWRSDRVGPDTGTLMYAARPEKPATWEPRGTRLQVQHYPLSRGLLKRLQTHSPNATRGLSGGRTGILF